VIAVGLLLLVSWWRRFPWLRQDRAEGAVPAAPASARRAALGILAVALSFQLGVWLARGATVSDKLGDDDEIYVFLALQLLGFGETPPVFALRAPGWPLILAGLLRLAGEHAVWIVGLYHRVLLATLPPLLYLILARFLRPSVAATAALLSLALPYNAEWARFALTDVSYTAGAVFVLAAVVAALSARRPLPWLVLGGAVAAGRTLVRMTGLGGAAAVAIALVLVLRGPIGRRAAHAGVFLLPTVCAILALSAYHLAVAGHFRPSMGGGLNFFQSVAARLSQAPDTPALRQLAALRPELSPSQLLHGDAMWVAQYRFTATGRGDVFDFGVLLDRAMRDLVLAAPGEYARTIGTGALLALAHPREDWIPEAWRRGPVDAPAAPPAAGGGGGLPDPSCGLQTGLGAAVSDDVCLRWAARWRALAFQPPALQAALSATPRALHRLVVTLPRQVRKLGWPLYCGLVALAATTWLLVMRATRPLALVLALAALADFAPVILVTGGVVTARHMLYLQPAFFVAAWLGLAWALEHLLRRQAARPGRRARRATMPAEPA
jgi:hypothetical protein